MSFSLLDNNSSSVTITSSIIFVLRSIEDKRKRDLQNDNQSVGKKKRHDIHLNELNFKSIETSVSVCVCVSMFLLFGISSKYTFNFYNNMT